MGKKQFCFFQTAETGNRTPDSGVKGSGANHYPRAPALNKGMSNVNKIIQVGLLLHKMVVILKNHDHFGQGLANMQFS